MKKSIILIFTLLSTNAFAKKALHAHEHGSANVSIAYEGTNAEIELHAPADSVLGFEHAAKTDKQKKIYEDQKNVWNNLLNELIIFPKELNCSVTNKNFAQKFESEEPQKNHKHKKHKHESHSEIEASATITCEKEIAGTLQINFKNHFKRMKNLKLEVLGKKPQTIKIKKASETITL